MNVGDRNGPLFYCAVLLLLITSTIILEAQEVRRIEILNADIIELDEALGTDAQRLIGNVELKHEDAIMTCDSAYFYSATYSVDAFSNVEIQQGDTLFLNGDRLHYEGETKIAEVRDNVTLVDKETTLRTQYLDYDRTTDIAYYLGGGEITQGENELTSQQGYYYTQTDIFFFKDSVVIINPEHTIYSDTLTYNTNTEISYFYGPTEIYGEENYIYCESGWYNTRKDISLVSKNAMLDSDGRILKGDTLYYERANGYGRARWNVEMIDTTQNVILRGNKGDYYEREQLATLTDSALMIQVEDSDSLFIHADTLKSMRDTTRSPAQDPPQTGQGASSTGQNTRQTTSDTTRSDPDTTRTTARNDRTGAADGTAGDGSGQKATETERAGGGSGQAPGDGEPTANHTAGTSADTANTGNTARYNAKTGASARNNQSGNDSRILLAYHKVKIYRKDIQGMCDSLVYIEKDSIFHFYQEPVLWSDENQLTAEKIELTTKNKQLHQIFLKSSAMLISMEDSAMFNQISGKQMTGYFSGNQLTRMDVIGNGQTIYYGTDQGEVIGVNRAICSDLIIYLEDNKVSRVNYIKQPSGTYYPLELFPPEESKLDGFIWLDQWRPEKREDVFLWK